jgi:hypothetical protein
MLNASYHLPHRLGIRHDGWDGQRTTATLPNDLHGFMEFRFCAGSDGNRHARSGKRLSIGTT